MKPVKFDRSLRTEKTMTQRKRYIKSANKFEIRLQKAVFHQETKINKACKIISKFFSWVPNDE